MNKTEAIMLEEFKEEIRKLRAQVHSAFISGYIAGDQHGHEHSPDDAWEYSNSKKVLEKQNK